jgi:phage tail sheath protein FI
MIVSSPGLSEESILVSKQKHIDQTKDMVKRCLNGVYFQTEAKVVLINCKEGKEAEKIKSLKNIEAELGIKPNIILCPKLWGKDISAYEPIKAELISIAKKLKAVAILDLPKEKTNETFSASERILGCYPSVKAPDGELTPYSAYLAGVMARTDEELGFWHSPSNKIIYGIQGMSEPIDYSDEEDSLAHDLNSKKIITIIRPNSDFRVWGNSGGYSEDQRATFRFLSVVRTQDVMNAAIKESLRWAIDQGITRNFLEQIQARVNNYLSALRKMGAIIDGYCWPDHEANTNEEIIEGRVHFQFKWTPVYMAESINFKSVLTDEYLKKLRS